MQIGIRRRFLTGRSTIAGFFDFLAIRGTWLSVPTYSSAGKYFVANAERASGNRLAIIPALLYFLVAYVLVTILAAAVSETYATIKHSPDPQPGQSILQAPAFVATVPYHVQIMFLVWPVFAWLYFRKRRSSNAEQERRLSLKLGAVWLVSAMLVDFVGFVLIKNQWSMTPHQLYVEYQPWISMIYLAIFVSPWIWLGFSRMLGRATIAD